MRGTRHLKTLAYLLEPQEAISEPVKVGDEWEQPSKPEPEPRAVKVSAQPRSLSLDSRLGIGDKLESEYTVAVFLREKPSHSAMIQIGEIVYRQVTTTYQSIIEVSNEFVMLVRPV